MASEDITPHRRSKRRRKRGEFFAIARRAAIAVLALALVGADRDLPYPAASAEIMNGRIEGSVPHYDYSGLAHLHTDYSDDATGSYESLATAAAAQGIRFLIVTDHDTLRAIPDGKPGWRDGVLMMTGVENSRPEGHLLALGVRTAASDHATPTTTYIDQAIAQGGQVVLAHPTHRKWAWEGPLDDRVMGLEVLDLADQFYAASTSAKVAAVAALPFRTMDAYLELGGRPDAALQMWDAIGRERRFVGLYAPDLHQALELSDDVKIPFPPAADIMRIARNHIVTARPFTGRFDADQAMVRNALSQGRVFIAVDVLGDAAGFMFTADGPDGQHWMGDEVAAGEPRTYRVALPVVAARLGAVTRLYRDGRIVAETRPGAGVLTFQSSEPGVYRVEVAVERADLSGRSREIVWIYSNPIYARG